MNQPKCGCVLNINCSLHEAAPDLLEACEVALSKMVGTGWGGNLGWHPDNPLPTLIREAIQKARSVMRVFRFQCPYCGQRSKPFSSRQEALDEKEAHKRFCSRTLHDKGPATVPPPDEVIKEVWI